MSRSQWMDVSYITRFKMKFSSVFPHLNTHIRQRLLVLWRTLFILSPFCSLLWSPCIPFSLFSSTSFLFFSLSHSLFLAFSILSSFLHPWLLASHSTPLSFFSLSPFLFIHLFTLSVFLLLSLPEISVSLYRFFSPLHSFSLRFQKDCTSESLNPTPACKQNGLIWKEKHARSEFSQNSW